MDRPVLLVEGESDAVAVRALARRLGLPLRPDSVVVMHGITNLRRHLRELSTSERARVGVLHDAGESSHVGSLLEEQDASLPTFVCVADLEDELIRAATVRSRYLYPSPALITRIETVTVAASSPLR